MAVRIGIDVGGTFTDAVVLDNETFELIGTIKIPTTHTSKQGVAEGIVTALRTVLEKYNIAAKDVVFIAHGTTQATNALLEGDVERVGIVGVGKGIEGYKVKLDTDIGNIELAPNKFLNTKHYYVAQDSKQQTNLEECVTDMVKENINVAVVSTAYSVDDPTEEHATMNVLHESGISGTCSHEISKLYGLRIRTRTAVINASILPKMMETADMTESSVLASDIEAPLMIMRCDGGVMNIKEVRKRPILTMLSGPAAGVAGALMYEKVSEGIFLEVGGTSTDISAIHNGQVMVSYAEVGGHKTYVNSLDVRTVGIAGGSMLRVNGSSIADVGPRSAHISNLPYIVYTPPEELGELEIKLICPRPGDFADYCSVFDKTNGKSYAITLACAANLSGYVRDNDYAKGYTESARKAFDVLSKHMGIDVDKILAMVHHRAAEKNKVVVKKLIEDYKLDPEQTVLVGGGGGASAVVPYLAKEMGLMHNIAKNAEVISPIGVALAMVRDIVERTVNNPTDDDILMIRKEAEQLAIKSGAVPGSIEVLIEVDAKNNIVRGIATGTTELRTKNRLSIDLSEKRILEIAKESMPMEGKDSVEVCAQSDCFTIVRSLILTKKLLGLFTKKRTPMRVVTREGVIRIQCTNGVCMTTNTEKSLKDMENAIGKLTAYTDGGEQLPSVYVLIGPKLVDCSKLMNKEQILSLLKLELAGIAKDEKVTFVFSSSI